MTSSRSQLVVTALGRGLRKRCPHCGQGRLFSGWSFLDRCSVCGLVFARNPGDTWAFMIIGDRVPLAGMIVLIYFGGALASCARRDDAGGVGGVGDLDDAESLGREYRAPLSVARVLARSGGSDPAAGCGGASRRVKLRIVETTIHRTSTGVGLSVDEPFPNWPSRFDPQQTMCWLVVIAHACR